MEQSYKEKYEQALEKIKNLIDKDHNDINVDDILNVFPELAESEDEQIKKWIINEIKIKHHNLDEENVDFVDKAIAWLERQGEKLPVGFYYVNSDGKKFYSDTLKYGDVILHVEKQGEQPEENKGNIGGISPNPEWSENDKAFLDDILCKLEHDLILNKDEKDWLKSLRPKNQWKPSEDDIIILEKLIKGELEPKVFQATLHGILEQLKKLKEG